jgi:hypothetical protein
VSPYIAADLIGRGDLAAALRMARTWHGGFNAGWRAIARQALWTFGLRPWLGAACSAVAGAAWDRNRAARMVTHDPSWIAPDPALRREQKRRASALVPEARPKSGFYVRELRTFLRDPLMPWFFEEQYELGRSIGVRYQHPYWDADLVEHMYRTPPAVLTRGGRTKALVRTAVDRRFPGLGFGNQRKVMAFAFFGSLASPALLRLASEYWDFRVLGSLGVVEPAAARAFVQAAPGRSPRTIFQAWRTIALEAWAQGRVNGASAKGKVT